MQVFEYYGRINQNGQLDVPDDLARCLEKGKKCRVMVFLGDDPPEWRKAAAESFLDGYAEEDKIYDAL